MADGRTDTVLELRVHGVNNTTPSALLDVPPDGVRMTIGDKLGSFWELTPEAQAGTRPGGRGYVPTGIRREAYSWGGMVRTVPDFGGPGMAGRILGVLARVFYALVLPFAMGNAVIWMRVLSAEPRAGWQKFTSGLTAGLARLFSLILTLLFATTVATLALDVGAAQCAAAPTMCGPLQGFFQIVTEWTPGQRLAAFALLPVLAVGVLWLVSAISKLRYDVLPGMDHGAGERAESPGAAAVLSQPGFWSNRVNRHLARLHFGAAICLTTLLVCLQVSLGWRAGCGGLANAFGCIAAGWSDEGFRWWVLLAGAALLLLLVDAGLIIALPTMRLLAEENEPTWPDRASMWLLIVSGALFGVILAILAFGPTTSVAVERQYGAGMAPVLLVAAGLVLVLWGVAWRPRTKDAAWSGRAPAVFMAISLAVATAMSAIVVVTTGDFLNGRRGPASLIGQDAETGDLEVSRSFVALGSLVLLGIVAALLIVGVFAIHRRDTTARADLWRRTLPFGGALPPTASDDVSVGDGGVLPPSPRNLFQRLAGKRATAARAHLAEPALAVLAVALTISLVLGVAWTLVSYQNPAGLWSWFLPSAFVERGVNVLMTVLAWSGVALLGVLALGGTAGGSRPLGIVWDIVCALPRTGHPFGPPCYAERAVPEIAGRLNNWLRESPDHRAILVAHSMGGVLAMSAIGLLSSSSDTRKNLHRISVLTFGVQLRPFFGRMLPELLGPVVLGTHAARSPRLWGADPWAADLTAERERESTEEAVPAVGQLTGTLVPRDAQGTPTLVRWISLWRLTDYLGYPALSTAPSGHGWVNRVDRCANELDTSGYMVEVGTHGEYYRVAEYTEAVEELRDFLVAQPD